MSKNPANRPEVMVPYVESKIDRSGRMADEKAKEKVKVLLESLVAWTRRLRERQYAQQTSC